MSYFKMEWVEKYLKNSPTVIFDIGSYSGSDGIAFKRRYESAKVIPIEAQPTLYKKIEKTYQQLNLNDIHIFNYAICDYDGDTDFYSVLSRHKGSGSIHKPILEISLENAKYYENSNVSTSEKLTEMGYELKEKIAGDALWTHKIQ